MNFSMVRFFLGWVLKIEAAMMLFPCMIALIYGEQQGFFFLGIAALCGILGILASSKKPSDTVFYAKEGFLSVALCWIVMSFFGSLPFYLSREIPVFVDAMFETISGFTTTGVSILSNVEDLSRCMLMWRSLTQWIGGMGVLLFLLAVLPLAGGYNIHIMRAESPGPSVGKLAPRVRTTAKLLYGIYLTMTIVQFFLLLIGNMPWFDSLIITFGTAGTGGFSILNDSLRSYTGYQQTVTAVFMILFGINFNVYFLFITGHAKHAFRSEEVRIYLGIILMSILLIGWNIRGHYDDIGTVLHHSVFQVGSIITTTGYSSVNFDKWPTFSKTILLMLMLSGACAGSTAGGIKISRIAIALKTIKKEMSSLLHPRIVKVLKFEGKIVEHHVLRSINAYLITYLFVFMISTLLISLDNHDFVTTMTSVTAAFSNVGFLPDHAWSSGGFYPFSVFSKLVLMFDMLAGRLEIFPMLLLFSPKTWSK